MPSFDTVCEPNMVEVKNAVENAAKEIGTRFDFKGTAAAIEVKDKEITLTGDAEFQLQQIMDILVAKLAMVDEAKARYEDMLRKNEAEVRSLLNEWQTGKDRLVRRRVPAGRGIDHAR